MKSYAELKALIEQRGVHPEFGDAGEGWGIEQNPHELATFLVRMTELNVTSCLEIGTGYKGGLSRFLAADLGWQVTSVDVQDYGHTFEGVRYVVKHHTNVGFSPGYFINGFDLIFIDGNHDYESVGKDYRDYGRLAKKVIAFHDILGLRDCAGVATFWNEISNNAPYIIAGQEITYAYPGFNEAIKPYKSIFQHERASGIGWIEL